MKKLFVEKKIDLYFANERGAVSTTHTRSTLKTQTKCYYVGNFAGIQINLRQTNIKQSRLTMNDC